MSTVQLVVEDLRVRTVGLVRRGQRELSVAVGDVTLLGEAEALARRVAAYVQQSGTRVRPNETVAHGYWTVQFREASQQWLEAWEQDPTASTWVPGATLTLSYWQQQHAICQQAHAAFSPPRPDQLVAVSAGVLEGDAVDGVRYASPSHMSGWWLTTDRYDGNAESLHVEHLYHVTATRPDLAPYLALPCSFRFTSREQGNAWFDDRVAASEATPE